MSDALATFICFPFSLLLPPSLPLASSRLYSTFQYSYLHNLLLHSSHLLLLYPHLVLNLHCLLAPIHINFCHHILLVLPSLIISVCVLTFWATFCNLDDHQDTESFEEAYCWEAYCGLRKENPTLNPTTNNLQGARAGGPIPRGVGYRIRRQSYHLDTAMEDCHDRNETAVAALILLRCWLQWDWDQRQGQR